LNLLSNKNIEHWFTDYVGEIYQTLVTTPRNELNVIKEELQASVPESMTSALDKESKSDAILKYKQRQAKETVICPPTCTGRTRIRLLTKTTQHNQKY